MKTTFCVDIWPTAIVCANLLFVSSFGMLRAQTPAGPNRPAGVPDEYVITPSGYFHSSCVKQLAKGEILLADGPDIQHADKSIEHIPVCAYPRYTAKGEVVTAGTSNFVSPMLSGDYWVEEAYANTNTSYSELVATWTVPQAPLLYDGQTLLYFPGMNDNDGSAGSNVATIIQPVLGWNAGSELPNQWSIASWNCCYGGNEVYSTHYSVNPGDVIRGTIQSTCSAGTLSCPSWNITTEDVTTGQSTTLSNTSNYGQTFNWAFPAVLEVYNIAQCSDYPPNGSVTFSDVALYDYNFNGTYPNWDSWIFLNETATPQCAYAVQTEWNEVSLFAGVPEMLTVSVSGSGTVTGTPPGMVFLPNTVSNSVDISCPGTCSAIFAQSTSVTLSASPASGYNFTGWSGACSGTGTCTVGMTSAKNVTATFALPTFTVSPISTSTPLSLGHTKNYTFKVSALNGFTGNVTLSAGGLPMGVTGSFSPSSINLTSANTSGTTTLTLTAAYSNSTYTGGSTGQTGAQTGVTVTGTSVSSTDSTVFDLNTRPLQYKGYCGVQ